MHQASDYGYSIEGQLPAQPEPTIPVIFRATRTKHPELTAMFPTVAWGSHGTTMACYCQVGQHGECSPCYVYRSRLATPEEYADLKRELEGLGYKLKVVKKITPAMHKARRKDAARMWRHV